MDHDPRSLCIVLPDLRVGGAQRVLLALAGRFQRMGLRVEIVSLLGPGALHAEVPTGVKYTALVSGEGQHFFVIRCLLGLCRVMRRNQYAAVLSSMTGTNMLCVFARSLMRSSARLVLREAVSSMNLAKPVVRWLLRWVYSRADAIIAVSQGVRSDLIAMGIDGARVRFIQNPVDATRLDSLSVAQPLPAPLMDRKRPYVTSVGRLVVQKDHSTLLRAFALSRLRESHDLVLVGDGPLRESLLREARNLGVDDRLILLGQMTNPYGVVAQAELFVLSSRWEGYPNVLLEALALGVPVVATDAPWGAREILGEGRFGQLVPPDDACGLARALESAIDGEFQAEPWQSETSSLEVVARLYANALFEEIRPG